MSRTFPRTIKRIVIKVGSSIIANYQMKARTSTLGSLVEQINRVYQDNIEVVLVSSGAIVLGMGELNERARPTELSALQARAAVGQAILMQTYNRLFRKNKIKCAQVLLTWDDFDSRVRFNNARDTLVSILKCGVIPVVNENDTISTEEIKFGDNDRLSALVASLVHADLLIILSDVEGLYHLKEGEKHIYEEIKDITDEIRQVASGTAKKHVSRGGMITKLEAVKVATHANIPCVIASGETPDVVPRILKGERIGTLFLEKEKLISRKHWISFGAKPKGKIIVDDGAKEALLKGGRSLLLPGIVSWEGHFKSDDVVIVSDRHNHEIGRGVTNYSVTDLHKSSGKKGKQEVIHCDHFVLGQR